MDTGEGDGQTTHKPGHGWTEHLTGREGHEGGRAMGGGHSGGKPAERRSPACVSPAREGILQVAGEKP